MKRIYGNILKKRSTLLGSVRDRNGGRAIFEAAQITQAVPLTNREVPLVQAATDRTLSQSFDEVVGKETALQTHVSGEVVGVTKKFIKVKTNGGAITRISLFDHLPLNQNSFIHSEPIVKKGDRIVKGQVIADTNNTLNGVLALGKNLLTAVMPWKGYNYEDGIVISENTAQQLTSEHLRENVARLNKNSVVSMEKYVAYSGMTKKTGRFWIQVIN